MGEKIRSRADRSPACISWASASSRWVVTHQVQDAVDDQQGQLPAVIPTLLRRFAGEPGGRKL